ncbi:MFS transporter [Falsihalocynthiibacter arcticus]|nr:MFS transporter [Falsihalocynthiibacter arcticus]
MAVFFVQPIQFGIWLSNVAEIKIGLALSNSDLALGLLGMPIGLLPSLYFASHVVDRIGPRHTLLWLFPLMLIAGVLPGFATGVGSLFMALFVLGALIAFTEVALNVFAARVEKTLGTSIMNRAHGFWSLGVMAGSFIGVQMAGLGFTVAESLQWGGLLLLPLLMVVAYILPRITPKQETTENAQAKPPLPKALLPIVAIVFGATIVEGAMIDWSTVYMRDVAEIIAGKEGWAVTIFAGFVTAGRFIGDAVNNRYGAMLLARMCIGSAILGLVILTLNLGPDASFLGFAFVGLGVSTIFPLGISASAALGDEGEARNVSVMTFGALSGFLVGPPMIGFVAEATSLNVAFALLLPTLALSFILAKHLLRMR